MVTAMAEPTLASETGAQIAALPLAQERPLIITDADEVLFAFMAAFEAFLEETGHFFDWSSFRLDGNIRRRSDSQPVERQQVLRILADFFAARTATIPPVAGAADALAALSRRAQVVVLSNIPIDHRPTRRAALARHGMDYPLVASSGPKGPAVSALAEVVAAPVFFLDDGPSHHASVAHHASRVRRLHLIADRRLAALVGPEVDCHHRPAHWGEARTLIEAELAAAGY
jgi:hypothetical protein